MSSRDTVQELDTATIIQFIAAQFPEVAPTTFEFLGEGSDFRAFIVNDRWVFRFPKSQEGAAQLRPEIAVLSLLAPHLPLPVPDYRFVGEPSADFSCMFAGYAKLPGVPAMRHSLPDTALSEAAQTMGSFLRTIRRGTLEVRWSPIPRRQSTNDPIPRLTSFRRGSSRGGESAMSLRPDLATRCMTRQGLTRGGRDAQSSASDRSSSLAVCLDEQTALPL